MYIVKQTYHNRHIRRKTSSAGILYKYVDISETKGLLTDMVGEVFMIFRFVYSKV